MESSGNWKSLKLCVWILFSFIEPFPSSKSHFLPIPLFQWVVASLIFQLPCESDTLNTRNTSFSTSHLFGSPSPLLETRYGHQLSAAPHITLIYLPNPQPPPTFHNSLFSGLCFRINQDKIYKHVLRAVCRYSALEQRYINISEQGRSEIWVLSNIS